MRDLCVCPEPKQVSYSPTATSDSYSSTFVGNYIGIGIVVSVSSIAGCIFVVLLYKNFCTRKQEDEIMDLDM